DVCSSALAVHHAGQAARGGKRNAAALRPRAADQTALLDLVVALVRDVERVDACSAVEMCEEKAVERRRRGQAGKAGHALAGCGRQSSSDGCQTDRRCAGADVELAKKDVDLPRV